MRMVIIPMRKRKHNEGIHKDTIRDAPRGCVARGKENIASRTALHRVRERMDSMFFRGIADGLCKLVPENISLPELGMRIKVYDEIVFEREYDEIAENAYEKIIDQTTAVCEAHYARILNKQLVKVLVENVREQYPGAADDLIPEKISYYQVLKRLRSVVTQQGQIRDLLHILEEMEEELTHAG